MNWTDAFSLLSDVAEIVTAISATLITGNILWKQRSRRKALEAYLQEARKQDQSQVVGKGTGMRTMLHLSAGLAMTEDQILEAAFGSENVKCRIVKETETSRAKTLVLKFE